MYVCNDQLHMDVYAFYVKAISNFCHQFRVMFERISKRRSVVDICEKIIIDLKENTYVIIGTNGQFEN